MEDERDHWHKETHQDAPLTLADGRHTAPSAILQADSPSRAIESIIAVTLVLDGASVVSCICGKEPPSVGQRKWQATVNVYREREREREAGRQCTVSGVSNGP